jgi:hypothetical protein
MYDGLFVPANEDIIVSLDEENEPLHDHRHSVKSNAIVHVLETAQPVAGTTVTLNATLTC